MAGREAYMTTDSGYLGSGVYVDLDQWGSIRLSYGGEGGPCVILNKDAIESLLVFLKVHPLTDIEPLRKARREEIERANAN
jgi:hypothetical protein